MEWSGKAINACMSVSSSITMNIVPSGVEVLMLFSILSELGTSKINTKTHASQK